MPKSDHPPIHVYDNPNVHGAAPSHVLGFRSLGSAHFIGVARLLFEHRLMGEPVNQNV